MGRPRMGWRKTWPTAAVSRNHRVDARRTLVRSNHAPDCPGYILQVHCPLDDGRHARGRSLAALPSPGLSPRHTPHTLGARCSRRAVASRPRQSSTVASLVQGRATAAQQELRTPATAPRPEQNCDLADRWRLSAKVSSSASRAPRSDLKMTEKGDAGETDC